MGGWVRRGGGGGGTGSESHTFYPLRILSPTPTPSFYKVNYFWLELEEGEKVKVNLRPKVDEFLLRLSDEYDTYIFTAATETYANPVLDVLDPTGR